MDKLFSPLRIRNTELKNRICIPPMVRYHWAGEDGVVSPQHIEYYRSLARGGAGLIVQEATCVEANAKLSLDELGIWSDEQIEGHRRIAQAVHDEGGVIIMQLMHAGAIGDLPGRMAPSEYACTHKGMQKQARAMTADDIAAVRAQFAAAARRAHQAGYDGVEIHGCHGYLLCQFLNRQVNRRTDRYGQAPEDLVCEIMDDIRAATDERFIIGVRLGAFEPDLADGLRHAQRIAAHGIDYISMAYAFPFATNITLPEGYPFSAGIYGAEQVKKLVSVPVFGVDGVCSGEYAERVLRETGIDMVAVGRGALINPNWANDVKAGRDPGRCLRCKNCLFRSVTPEKCPGRAKFLRSRA